MIGKILIPLDGSEHAAKALRFALDLAEKDRSELVLVHVLLREMDVKELRRLAEAQELPEEQRQALQRAAPPGMAMGAAYVRATVPTEVLQRIGEHILASAERLAQEAGIARVTKRLEDGDAAKTILAAAEREQVDTIVMGSRGLGYLQGIFIGSVSHKVSQHARCTCVLVK